MHNSFTGLKLRYYSFIITLQHAPTYYHVTTKNYFFQKSSGFCSNESTTRPVRDLEIMMTSWNSWRHLTNTKKHVVFSHLINMGKNTGKNEVLNINRWQKLQLRAFACLLTIFRRFVPSYYPGGMLAIYCTLTHFTSVVTRRKYTSDRHFYVRKSMKQRRT